MSLKFCTIHLAFNRGYFEADLIENTLRTLGFGTYVKYFNNIAI